MVGMKTDTANRVMGRYVERQSWPAKVMDAFVWPNGLLSELK